MGSPPLSELWELQREETKPGFGGIEGNVFPSIFLPSRTLTFRSLS